MLKGVKFWTYFLFNLHYSHISSSSKLFKWKKYTRIIEQETKDRTELSLSLFTAGSFDLYKSEHTLQGRKIFFLQLWGMPMNLKIIKVFIVKENLSLISDFLGAWFIMFFSTTLSLNEHQIKEESSTHKKRPQGQ